VISFRRIPLTVNWLPNFPLPFSPGAGCRFYRLPHHAVQHGDCIVINQRRKRVESASHAGRVKCEETIEVKLLSLVVCLRLFCSSVRLLTNLPLSSCRSDSSKHSTWLAVVRPQATGDLREEGAAGRRAGRPGLGPDDGRASPADGPAGSSLRADRALESSDQPSWSSSAAAVAAAAPAGT